VSSRTPKRPPPGSTGTGAGAGKDRRSPQTSVTSRPVSSARTASGRQSVASAREMSPSANRTQMIIGGIAVVLIAVIVVIGLVWNKKQNASPVTDHPVSTNSTASLDNGVVVVTGIGATPAVTIDLYEDGLCPNCQTFEGQYGQQVMKGVDEGKLAVRYHFLNFLNPNSASKTYSTRAAAAFECIAAVPADQAPKGLFLNFHTTMFSTAVQPAEQAAGDLSNAQIADLAVKAGAPQSAAACISTGANVAPAEAAAKASTAQLTALVPNGVYYTPSATQGSTLLDLNSTDWLTKLIG
jgi:protein-disulfide isomerase